MKYLVTSDSTVVTDMHTLELDDLSVNIPKCYTLWSPEKCKVKTSNPIIITGVDENRNVITGDSIEVDAKGSFSLLLESDKETTDFIICLVEYETGERVTFRLSQRYVDSTDRLVVLLNNYGIQITDDWSRCFYESDIHEPNVDQVLKNRKSSEFLFELMNLVGLRGTYKTLFSAVSYFGYKDVVWFEEHWINNADGVTRRYTEITSDFIERRLTDEGYTKIGDMTMFYGLSVLDPEEPYDEGGLPNYVSRNINFDDLYFKLLLLRKILNSTFIPWDAYIVDVVGELKAIEGQQKKWWVASDAFITVDERKRYDFLNVEFDGDFIEENNKRHLILHEHKMIVDTSMYDVNYKDEITLTTRTAHLTSELIKIEKLDVDEKTELKDFDIITKFHRKDVAVVIPRIILNSPVPDWITGFRVQLNTITQHGVEPLITSKLMSFDELTANSQYGITKTGEYEFVIRAYDCWGNNFKYFIRFDVCEQDIATDFNILLPQFIGTERDYVKRFMQLEQTQQTIYDGISVVDASDKEWDVNKPDENISVVARKYSVNFDKNELFLPIRRYGTAIISDMDKMPIDEFWAPYNLLALNILKSGVKFSLKIFSHQEYETIEFKNEIQFLHDLIEASKNPNSAFNFFEFDIQPVNTTYTERLIENENDVAIDMLLIYSRLKSFSIDKVIFRIEYGDDVLTNDSAEQGTLTLHSKPITWFGRKFILFTNNANSNIPITSMDSRFDTYKSRVYPAFGCDAMIRFNTIYNTTLTSVERLVLNNGLLTLYNNPLAVFTTEAQTYLDDGGCTGILDFFYKELYLGDKRLELYPGQIDNKLLIDYHIKLRVGNVWFMSVKEYGKLNYKKDSQGNYKSYFETEPLDFAHLKSILDKNDPNFVNEMGLPDEVLNNIEVYYYDSSFVVRAKNGLDIELAQINIGHKMSAARVGSISKMYKHPSGVQLDYGTVLICMPNQDVRFDNCDVTWKVIDHFTKQEVFTSYGWAMKYICMQYGVFDIEMTINSSLNNKEYACKKMGAFLV